MQAISGQIKKKLLHAMLKIRRFEEKVTGLYPEQEMKTPVHLCIGQEAIAAGVCANLKKDDYIFSTHRNHGHYIAKGADIKALAAEFYGRSTGCSRGRGGSMHTTAPEWGILGTSAIVGGCIALAAGAALSIKMKNEGKVSVAFFGDGAVDEGTFHESLNFASLKKLPVVFVCENNFYATNSHISSRQPCDNIAKRAAAYAMPGVQVDGNDVLKIFIVAREAVRKARQGKGPTLIEARTYRWRGHVGPECDYEKGCRLKNELESWFKRCPIELFKERLRKNKIISQSWLNRLTKGIDEEIESAFCFAKESPVPGKDELLDYVYTFAASGVPSEARGKPHP